MMKMLFKSQGSTLDHLSGGATDMVVQKAIELQRNVGANI